MADPVRILLCEDVDGPSPILAMLDAELSRQVEVTSCGMLCEALLAASTSQFDVALVDIHLPDAGPDDVVALVMSVAPDLPLIAMTRAYDEELGTTLIQQGAEDLLSRNALNGAALARIITYATKRGTSRAHYRGVIAHLPDPLIVIDRRGVIEFANHAAAALFGRGAAQLAGRTFPLPVVNEAGRAETWIRHAAGATSRVELAVVESHWAGRPAFLVSIRDITQRHEAVAALHSEARKFETLVRKIPGLVWTTDRALDVEHVSGGQLSSFEGHHPGLREGQPDVLRLLGEGDAVTNKLTRVMAGDPIYQQVQMEGRHWEVHLEPLHSDDGDATGVIGFATDATEKVQMELALSQAQKLEAVGQLAAGVAHELNTPMQYLNDNLQFMQKAMVRIDKAFGVYEAFIDHLAPSEESRAALTRQLRKVKLEWVREQSARALEQSLEGVEQASRIVRAMKESVHQGSGELAPTDVNKLIRGAVDVSRNEWKYVAEVTVDLDPHLPPAWVMAGEISQVILNLVINAAHAIAEKNSEDLGSIAITSSEAEDRVEIRIRDDAGGIPEHVRDRIFDPFFTTKEVGKGTGQGLAIARRIIVDTHGGALRFETETGVGTTFIIELPINEEAGVAQLAG